jgi:adenylylsulfate kinase
MIMSNNKSPVIWFTGMSGSGKSTLSFALEQFYYNKQLNIHVIDGDEVRGIDKVKLGFGYDDVLTNNLRIAHQCQTLRAKYDAIVVPVISPYDKVRMMVRSALNPNFHLVYLKTDINSLRHRDPKGLYEAADKGVISDLIGYSNSNPYDVPSKAEITIDTSNDTPIEESQRVLFEYIRLFAMTDK